MAIVVGAVLPELELENLDRNEVGTVARSGTISIHNAAGGFSRATLGPASPCSGPADRTAWTGRARRD